MIKQSPYRNIFMYYRGASVDETQADRQLEDNITKSLINLFEHSDKNLLKDFLKSIGVIISPDDVVFDLQVALPFSRPDALIRTNECDIYIESKFGASFDCDQLQNHLDNIEGYLLYISKEKYKEDIKQNYCDGNVIFLTWTDIATFIIKESDNTYPENTVTSFLSKQYINFMEELNMIPFRGWTNRDFESFLVTDNQNPKIAEEERKRVKEKLEQFLNESKENIDQKCDFYKGSELIIGNLDKEHVWAAIQFRDGRLVNQIHVSVIMNAYNFSIGIQIEGYQPTQKAIQKIKNDKEGFQKILEKLTDFNYVIRKRYQIQASKWDSDVVAQIVIGQEITDADLDYIVKKMEKYKYVELRIPRIYEKHKVIDKGEGFIEECADTIVMLNEIIQFLE
jgi:uncharacterized protein YggL (DUF469 family)